MLLGGGELAAAEAEITKGAQEVEVRQALSGAAMNSSQLKRDNVGRQSNKIAETLVTKVVHPGEGEKRGGGEEEGEGGF